MPSRLAHKESLKLERRVSAPQTIGPQKMALPCDTRRNVWQPLCSRRALTSTASAMAEGQVFGFGGCLAGYYGCQPRHVDSWLKGHVTSLRTTATKLTLAVSAWNLVAPLP